MVHDIRLETWRRERGPLLEVSERTASSLVPDTAAMTPSASYIRASEAARNAIEKQRFAAFEENYGWVRYCRLQRYQRNAFDDEDAAKCRWIHCSSKLPEYLRGFLWALSEDLTTVGQSIRLMDQAMQRQTRFSKHGKHFAPFCQILREDAEAGPYPMLMSVPFLDWTVQGEVPPLRFQVDKREGFHSTRSSAHLLRSILQHFYRLEDTADREGSQVFAKHKPWSTDRELDLKVRQWYGHYPSGLNVDELWILVVDAENIVTFSSNQTWKSRWPPLQLASRIADVSFREIRNSFYNVDEKREYDAMVHCIASLGGACGMLHRSFWPDMVLCLTDRYAGYLGHLQYRLHRSPSTKLVMDLVACQEELNIVVQITRQQIELITELRSLTTIPNRQMEETVPSPASRFAGYEDNDDDLSTRLATVRHRATYRHITASHHIDPVLQLLDKLQQELVDLQEMRDNTDRLVSRTIQLVNMRLEDHGKAILVFTVVTIVFLPLNFVSSFFGMFIQMSYNHRR